MVAAATRASEAGGAGTCPPIPELADIDRIVLAGERVAFGSDGKPRQPRLCRRRLAGDRGIASVLVEFDVLSFDGRAVAGQPYRERRRRLEALDLRSPSVYVRRSDRDGGALWEAIVGEGLRASSPSASPRPTGPGERSWIKRN